MEAFKTPADVLSAFVTRCVNAGMRSRRRKYGRRRRAWSPASAADMTSAVCALRCGALRSAHQTSARVPAGWCAATAFWAGSTPSRPCGSAPACSLAPLASRRRSRRRGAWTTSSLDEARRLQGDEGDGRWTALRAGNWSDQSWPHEADLTTRRARGGLYFIYRPPRTVNQIPPAQRPAFLAARGVRRRPERRRLPFCAHGDRTCTFPWLLLSCAACRCR